MKGGRLHQPPSRAFTLMETLVALGLLLVLVGLVFAFGMNLTASRDRLNRHMRRSQAVRVFLDRLEQDLRTSVASDAGQGAGIVGDGSSIKVLSRSVGAMGQSQGLATALSDLQRSEFRWDDGARLLQGSRGAASADPALSNIADDLGYVQWRYHNGSGWVERFDSGASGRLPVAVEVAVWFVAPPRDPQEPGLEEDLLAQEPDDPLAAMFGSPRPASPDSTDVPVEVMEEERRDWPPPDRVRLIIIPDAPEFEYGRSYSDETALDAPPPLETGGSQ
ncbi:MAG: hypothetical protein IT430_07355 [Phycisphaerales bacterium]|nr:hypothetical protein [Phycisphaerales bacterium]